ncbi:hypothetical protein RB195_025047 [Necator americanus]|uniref:Uncharacterized protein n=1 Tax=Necator americanus TaxID=51031 RepID=A0ABR1EQR0_NECAM
MLLNKKCSTDDIDSVAAAEDTVQVTGQKNNAIDYPFEDLLEARVWINVAQMHLCTTAVSQRTLALNRCPIRFRIPASSSQLNDTVPQKEWLSSTSAEA